MDNIGVLRSIFKIQRLNNDADTYLNFKEHKYRFYYENHKLNLESTLQVIGQNYHNKNYI